MVQVLHDTWRWRYPQIMYTWFRPLGRESLVLTAFLNIFIFPFLTFSVLELENVLFCSCAFLYK